jgi:hypothetical protein
VAADGGRDPSQITAQCAPNAAFCETSSKTARTTPAQITEYFKNVATQPDVITSIDEQHIRVYGAFAYANGYNTFSDAR